jgi:hypothetical protein
MSEIPNEKKEESDKKDETETKTNTNDNNDNNNTNVKINQELIDDNCKCDVCKDFLFEPVTLFCQHTFCKSCVISLKQCPICRLKIYIPKNQNKIFTKLIDILYGPEKTIELANKFKKEKIEKELKPKILDELRKNLNITINNDVPINPSSITENNRIHNPQTTTNNNQIPQDVTICGINITFILKFVEVCFLIYYIYGFIKSLRCEINWFRTGLNLIIIIQSINSLFIQPYLIE